MKNTKERIQELASSKSLTLAELERKLDISNGTIGKWDVRKPNSEPLEKVANYFDVSVDYLLGRTEKKRYYDLTEKDERDIQKELEKMIEDLSNGGALAFSKDDGEMSEETRQALIISLENSLRIARIEAKKKYTPKKYRD